jgi:hypothetical protein
MTGYSTSRLPGPLVDINSLKHCKSNEVKGSGTTNMELTKCAENYLLKRFLAIINTCLKFGYVSNECSMGKTVPIYEREERNGHQNYQGISLLNTC